MCGKFQSFVHGEVWRPGSCELVDCPAGLQCYRGAEHQLAAVVGKDVNAEQATCSGLGNELDGAVGVAVDDRARDEVEGEDPAVGLEPGCGGFGLGEAGPGELRCRECDVR